MEDKIEINPVERLKNARDKYDEAKNCLVEATTDLISIGGFSEKSIDEMKTTIGDLTLSIALMDQSLGDTPLEKKEEKSKIGF